MSKDAWVDGEGPAPCDLLICGEAPGEQECRRGRPFVGPTGMETNHVLREFVGLGRHEVYVTNVFKWPLNDKKEYTGDEWKYMGEILEGEVDRVKPKVILALGAIATKFFVGDRYDMEAESGVPHSTFLWPAVVIPSFHPAAMFKDSTILRWVHEAFDAARNALDGKVEWVRDKRPKPRYTRIVEGDLPLPGTVFSLDTEADPDGRLTDITMSDVGGTAYWIDMGNERAMMQLRTIAADHHYTVLMHNAPYDLPQLRQARVLPHHWIDTMVMAFMLQTLPLGLKGLAHRLCGMEMKEYENVNHNDFDEHAHYACRDADATVRVYEEMIGPLLGIHKSTGEALRRDMEIIPMIVNMMENGIKVDLEFLHDMEVKLTIRNMELQARIDEVARAAGWKSKPKSKSPIFNPASAPQVANLLYEVLRLGRGHRIKRTKWGGSTASKEMKKMAGEHPVVDMVEDWRETDTLVDKFLSILPRHVGGDGRIHTKISMIRVKHSGRLASSSPNLMAQPVRTEDGMRVRNGFVASEGFTLASFDYNQIEMRLMAHLSQDRTMLDVYERGGDIHTDTAMRMFKIGDPGEVDEMKHRYPAKRTGFGIINLITAHGLARELVSGGAGLWTEEECQRLLDAWFDIYPGVRRYFDRVTAGAGANGRVVDMWGRMAYIPEVYSYFPHVREAGERRAVNHGIQSGAQGVIKSAMVKLWPWSVECNRRWDDLKGGDSIRWLLQIHDSLEAEIRDEILDEMIPCIKNIMEGVVNLSIPITVGVKCGRRWGSLRSWKPGNA